MKNILVPTDFSACAEAAADLAIDLAARSKASIHFMHMLHAPTDWVKLTKEQEERYPETRQAIGAARGALDTLVKQARERGLVAQQFLSFDDTLTALMGHVTSLEHDLIIVGAHGARGVNSFLVGSSTRKVIRHARVPVLVVKEKVNAEELRTMVFASDMRSGAEEHLPEVIRLAEVIGSRIQLLYVNTPVVFEESPDIHDRMDAMLDRCPAGTTTAIHNALNVERGILQFAERNKVDLIAMTTEGRTGAFQLISHSIAEAVVNGANVPVLTMNLKNQ